MDEYLTDEDKAFLGISSPSENEKHWRKKLSNQGELKATPPRSSWRRFMDNIEETVRQGPGALIAGRLAPLVETGDGKTYEQRRQEYTAKENERRKNVAAIDPADSVGDYVTDIAGSIVGSVISDPTNLVNPVGGIGRKIIGNAAVGGLGDAALQGGELVEGFRDEYDPIRTGVNVAAAPAIIGGAELVKKGVKALARPPKDLDLDTAVGIGDKFGTVTSTVRTPARNKKVGGAKNSHHLYGRAIDIARGKGVTHKQIERAYRRAGYDIIESLDEGDHSHFAFRFRDRKAPGGGGPRKGGEGMLDEEKIAKVADLDEARAKKTLDDWTRDIDFNEGPRTAEEWDAIRQADDASAPYAPPLDSSHEKFTPYVERPNTPANENPKAIDPFQTMFDVDELTRLNRRGELSDDDYDDAMDQILRDLGDEEANHDVLTPAERQEMDASAVRPDVDPTVPAGLGKGSVATTPVNDLHPPERPRYDPNRQAKDYTDQEWARLTNEEKAKALELGRLTPVREPLPSPEDVAWASEQGAYDLRTARKKLAERDALGTDPKYDRNNPPERPPYPGEEGFPKPGEPGNRGGPKGGADDPVEQRLIADLKKLKPMTGDQRRLYREERSKRGSSLSNLQKGEATRENIAQQFGSQRGQLPKRAFQSIAENYTDADFVSLANRINHSPRLLPFQKLNAHKALINLLGAEGAKLPTPSEIKLLSEVYSEDFVKAIMENRPLLTKIWDHTKSALNVPRAIMSSMDFSAPFRQGIGLVHKKEFWKAIPHMFNMWADTVRGGAKDKDWLNSLKSHPRWGDAVEAKLAITDPHSHFLADREEDFMTDWAERIPFGVGRLIKGSNSAYSGFLNKLRWDTFNNLLDQMESMGEAVDGKQLKQLGKFVNMATGRGDLGKTMNAAAPAFSALLFSPRLIASRLKTLASPVTYMTADPLVRKEAWKSLLAMSAYYMTLGGIAKYMMGMDVETDPRSSDFMKAKIGNTRYDFLAGYSQYIRLGAQILTDKTITGKGVEKDLTSSTGYKDDTRRDVFIRFFLNKLAPVPSLVSDWMEGSDMTGEPFEIKKAVTSRMLPMASQDIADAIREWGPIGAAMGLPGLGGWSVQTYEPRQKEAEPVSDEEFLSGDVEGSSESDDLSAEDKEFLGL